MLTKRQREALAAIAEHIAAHGYAPTYRELADRLSLASASNAHRLVVELERCGAIRREPGRVRALKLASGWRDPRPAARKFAASLAA